MDNGKEDALGSMDILDERPSRLCRRLSTAIREILGAGNMGLRHRPTHGQVAGGQRAGWHLLLEFPDGVVGHRSAVQEVGHGGWGGGGGQVLGSDLGGLAMQTTVSGPLG